MHSRHRYDQRITDRAPTESPKTRKESQGSKGQIPGILQNRLLRQTRQPSNISALGLLHRELETYVETQLAPLLNPGTVDNLSTYKSPRAAEALKQPKSWFLFLPPYSPDLNPIEQAFSKLKAHLRRIGGRTYGDLIAAIGGICGLFDPTECWNFFKAVGYAPD